MMTEPPPTNAELVAAIDDLFYAAHQSALYVYWHLIRRPVVQRFEELGIKNAELAFSNGILESSLMLLRKTTEFFKPKEPRDRPDNLYYYQYFPDSNGIWLFDKQTLYLELHKRVGHITVREARHKKMYWPIQEMTLSAVEKWICFFKELNSSPVFQGSVPSEKLRNMVESLEVVRQGCVKLLVSKGNF